MKFQNEGPHTFENKLPEASVKVSHRPGHARNLRPKRPGQSKPSLSTNTSKQHIADVSSVKAFVFRNNRQPTVSNSSYRRRDCFRNI
jgi:hypothetical protein